MKIEGSGALVSGGASGLGEATARLLRAGGAEVVIADIGEERGRAIADELGSQFVRADVTDPDQVQEAVTTAAELSGGLRISVCCAGIGWAERVASQRGPHSLEPFETVVRVNLIGTFNVLRFAATAYSASKAGIVGLTLPAARDLARVGIRVCTIAPGTFDTPLLAALPEDARTALGTAVPHPSRLGQPREFAQLAIHIAENQMLNGETIRLDGALRMAPK